MLFIKGGFVCRCFYLLLAFANASWSLDTPLNEKALWLPAKYQGHYIELVSAAQAALDLPRCIEVKQATLDLRQSTPEKPIYRVLCLQESGKTYTEMIDGDGYISLTPEKNSAMACHKLLLEKTQQMIDISWLEGGPKSVAGGSEGGERYQWDFDAKSLDGDALHYTAICVADDGVPVVTISARR